MLFIQSRCGPPSPGRVGLAQLPSGGRLNPPLIVLSSGSEPGRAGQGPARRRLRLHQVRRPFSQPHQRLRLLFRQDAGRSGQHGGVPALRPHPHQVRGHCCPLQDTEGSGDVPSTFTLGSASICSRIRPPTVKETHFLLPPPPPVPRDRILAARC